MDVNPLNSQGNAYQASQAKGETKKEQVGSNDSVELKIGPGHITCYMYAKMKTQKGMAPEVLSQHRTEAINNALNDGSITAEMAQKLLAE